MHFSRVHWEWMRLHKPRQCISIQSENSLMEIIGGFWFKVETIEYMRTGRMVNGKHQTAIHILIEIIIDLQFGFLVLIQSENAFFMPEIWSKLRLCMLRSIDYKFLRWTQTQTHTNPIDKIVWWSKTWMVNSWENPQSQFHISIQQSTMIIICGFLRFYLTRWQCGCVCHYL